MAAKFSLKSSQLNKNYFLLKTSLKVNPDVTPTFAVTTAVIIPNDTAAKNS